eukprot:m.2001 g.2001  ORF g.2001 m.2001 type:complete len:52 (-) comp1327_c0_seq1:62-217(-)
MRTRADIITFILDWLYFFFPLLLVWCVVETAQTVSSYGLARLRSYRFFGIR